MPFQENVGVIGLPEDDQWLDDANDREGRLDGLVGRARLDARGQGLRWQDLLEGQHDRVSLKGELDRRARAQDVLRTASARYSGMMSSFSARRRFTKFSSPWRRLSALATNTSRISLTRAALASLFCRRHSFWYVRTSLSAVNFVFGRGVVVPAFRSRRSSTGRRTMRSALPRNCLFVYASARLCWIDASSLVAISVATAIGILPLSTARMRRSSPLSISRRSMQT